MVTELGDNSQADRENINRINMHESDREIVKQLVQQELQAHGFRIDEPHEDQHTMRWLRDHQKAFESAGGWVWRSIVLAMASALIVSVWEGFKVLTRQ